MREVALENRLPLHAHSSRRDPKFGFLCKHTNAYYIAFNESGVLPGAYHDLIVVFML